MNKLTIIGNLTRNPEMRNTTTGKKVCNFTVAVNRRQKKDAQNNQPEADFFVVSAWDLLGENCSKYLSKGSKVAVVGSVSGRTYTGNDGKTYFVLEINRADDVEFLSSKSETAAGSPAPQAAPTPAATQGGFTAVETDELPF